MGYSGQELALGRLLLCGFNVTRSLWRDSKYDGMVEVNNETLRIEIKSTGANQFSFTSGVRTGKQISRRAGSREEILKKNDADFFIGVSINDGICWIVPVELIVICKRKTLPISAIEKFKEKFKIFLGFPKKGIVTKEISSGFSSKTVEELESFCRKNKIRITNSEKNNNFKYPKEKVLNRGVSDIITNYKDSLILDIWLFLYNNIE